MASMMVIGMLTSFKLLMLLLPGRIEIGLFGKTVPKTAGMHVVNRTIIFRSFGFFFMICIVFPVVNC